MSDQVLADLRRRDFLRLAGSLGAASALAGTLSACGGPASTGGSGGDADSIEAGISYSLSTGFDPMTSSGATPQAANLHVFEALVDLDPVTRKPYPALATAMPTKVDDTTYRVGLRKGATFHDGSPVTADDVAFSFDRILDSKNNSLMVQFLPFLKSVSVVDDHTVELHLKYPFGLLTSRLAVAKVVPKKIVSADPKAFDAKPVGSGPFRLVQATRQDKIVFAKWKKYNGPRAAKVSTMTWRLLSEPSARVSAMESGRVLAIEDVPYIDVKKLSGSARLKSVQSFGMLFLMFNCKAEPFTDKRVRQALHYALNVDKIIKTAMVGNGTAASSYLQPTHPDYRKAATVYRHNQDKARGLLDAAGVGKLSLTVLTTDTGWVKDIAPIIKESFDAVGITTKLDIGDSSGQYQKVSAGKYRVMVAPGDPSVFGNDVDLLMRWFYDGNWAENYAYWAGSPEQRRLISLLDRAVHSSDADTQHDLWGQAIDLVADEVPVYPILHRKLPTAWDADKLDGFRPLATTGLSFLDVGRS